MRILVVFHIFYQNLAEYYLNKIKNLEAYDYDLLVTGNDLSEETKDKVKQVKHNARFLSVGNTGYDIWPFIYAIKNSDLTKYDIVIKLHTKNEDGYSLVLNGVDMNGKQWKEFLVESMLGSPEKAGRLVRIFQNNNKAGIVYNRQLGFISKCVQVEDCTMLKDELARLGIKRRGNHFCAGTMYAVRSSALDFLKREDINEETFPASGPSHSGATMSHVYERLIPLAIQSQGFRYIPLFDNKKAAIKFTIKDIFTPTLEWIFSVNRYSGINNKCITVFGFKFIVSTNKK